MAYRDRRKCAYGLGSALYLRQAMPILFYLFKHGVSLSAPHTLRFILLGPPQYLCILRDLCLPGPLHLSACASRQNLIVNPLK